MYGPLPLSVAAVCRHAEHVSLWCRKRFEPAQVAVGDLVFFATGKDANRVSHVGIVIDDRQFIHASSSKGVVISDMTTPYYQRTSGRRGA